MTFHSKLKSIWRIVFGICLALALALPGMARPAGVRITVWSIYQPGLDKMGDWLQQKITQYEKANPGIDIEHRFWDNQSY